MVLSGFLPVAAGYGCHALRPGNIVRLDNPPVPGIFEVRVAVTRAEPVAWARRHACCGNPQGEKNNELSLPWVDARVSDARQSGADVLCPACTPCQIPFDAVQAQRPNRADAQAPCSHPCSILDGRDGSPGQKLYNRGGLPAGPRQQPAEVRRKREEREDT